MTELLKVDNLNVSYSSDNGKQHAVKNISFSLKRGESLALVGESGCGKTSTANAIMQLLGDNAKISGNVTFRGKPLNEKNISKVRGKRISMIFQNPMSSLNPFLTIQTQIVEQILQHTNKSKKEAIDRTIELLKKVGIDNPEKRLMQYPHEFSGGMQQRVVIAMALSCNPYLIIADEPTTALDVTIQAQIIKELNKLVKDSNLSLLLISHDLGVVANLCDEVAVMKKGEIVEQQKTEQLFKRPHHKYTRQLLDAVPTFSTFTEAKARDELITVSDLSVVFSKSKKESFHAVDSINFELKQGEILGIAGESGSGKSTTLRALTQTVDYDSGEAIYQGQNLLELTRAELLESRQKVQMIFQDPYNSLNPRWRITKIIAEPLKNLTNLSKKERNERVKELMKLTEIDESLAKRFPHELSGGQCQRVGIARAIANNPEVLLCDEPVSALDVVVQKQIIELLKKLRRELNISMIFVSHDLAVVSELCDRVLIMKNGRIVEQGRTEQVFNQPMEDYTRKLICSVPLPDPHKKILV